MDEAVCTTTTATTSAVAAATQRCVQFTAVALGQTNGSGSASSDCAALLPHHHHNDGPHRYYPFRGGRLLAINPYFESSKYYYCCGRGHVTVLTRWIGVIMIPIYMLITLFMFLSGCLFNVCSAPHSYHIQRREEYREDTRHVGTATIVLFTILLLASISASTIYGSLTGSKLCLIPFLFLQVILMLYSAVLFSIFTAALAGAAPFLMPVIETGGWLSQPTAVLLLACSSVIIFCFLAVTSHIVFLDYLFIQELDETLQVLEQIQATKQDSDELIGCSKMII
ncbi:hypothetical protein PRIPAC_73307 [Pristionchus pacificus]|uniref:Uncharacterized protein n=1 Tax=Pristionchus pacificus TaxID=54126 RepID=A0A2A6CEY7_PRIPA|nr:hypothetical protein PRIPAC_73307 [Pristionchus pacificus]|eukprot:PDM76805.1 hypothetical protein PRIPAC_42200 [Pristionchus pacificus]